MNTNTPNDGPSAVQSDPFSQLFRQIAEEAARLAVEQYAAEAQSQAASRPLTTMLDLYRAYRAREVAAWIGSTEDAVYMIPENLLRPVYTGPRGGSKRYLGINILMYLTGQEPVDTEAVGRAVREEFIRSAKEPVTIRRAPGANGRVRVL